MCHVIRVTGGSCFQYTVFAVEEVKVIKRIKLFFFVYCRKLKQDYVLQTDY
jgi:hypothetical protein